MNFHETIMSTPEPSAWSTEVRRESKLALDRNDAKAVRRSLYSLDVSSESLGILSLDDMKPTKETSLITTTNDCLSAQDLNSLEQRTKALETTRALLAKFANRHNSLSLNHSSQLSNLMESTVNESDLLRETHHSSMNGTGTINESDLLRQSSVSLPGTSKNERSIRVRNDSSRYSMASDSLSQYIEDLKTKFQANTSASFSDIIADKTKHSFTQSDMGFDSGMFRPASEVKDQFEEDERAWREKYASIPNTSRTSFNSVQQSFDDKYSMGEFFKGKSDDCTSIFDKNSPIKHEPVPLVNSTSIEDDSNVSNANQSIASVLSLSDIRNLITEEDATPMKVVERLMQAPQESRRKDALRSDFFNGRSSLGSPKVDNSRYAKAYASSSDLRAQSPQQARHSLHHISNKENVPQDEKNRTLTSVRSSSSMDSIPDGMAKLASTKSELVWGCVKEGRSIVQDITIRNKNNRRVKYMIHTSNSTFKLINIDSQSDKAIILLHPLETRQLHIQFTPNATGPQVGQVFFTPVIRKEELTSNRQHIAMYGYGGHVNINIKGQTRDLCGKLWVSLGCIDGRQELCADFLVHNTGSIDGFVSFTVNSKSLCAYEDIALSPSKIVVKRGTEQLIRVKFRPSKNDLHLLNAVLSNKSMKATEIAVIRMITGADINRQRIIKLNKKISKDYDLQVQDPVAQQLCCRFQGEKKSDEVRYFNESVKSVKTLMQCLDSSEISLLVDRDMDTTIMPEVDDSTVIFNTMICPDESSMLDGHRENSYVKYFSLEPSNVILTPPSKCVDYLLLSSNYHRPVFYKITMIPGSLVMVQPSHGEIHPGEIKKIRVACEGNANKLPRQDVKCILEIEDDVLNSVVSILHLG